MVTKPPVIITRAEPGASETFERLRALPCRPVLSPMLEITPDPFTVVETFEAAQGLVFTSANGVRAFQATGLPSLKPAWCVGPATYEAAQSAGFTRCHNADGNADDLAKLILKKARPQDGPLIHIANKAAAGNLAGQLRAAGFEVEFAPLYSALPVQRVSLGAQKALQRGPGGIVLIHSAKGAEAALAAIEPIRVSGNWSIVAVSERAGKPLSLGKGWPLYLPSKPNESALLAVLEDRLSAN